MYEFVALKKVFSDLNHISSFTSFGGGEGVCGFKPSQHRFCGGGKCGSGTNHTRSCTYFWV